MKTKIEDGVMKNGNKEKIEKVNKYEKAHY